MTAKKSCRDSYPHKVFASYPNVRFYSNCRGLKYSQYGIIKASVSSVRVDTAIEQAIKLEIWAEDDPALGHEVEMSNGFIITLTLDQVREIRDLLTNVLHEVHTEGASE